MLLAAGKEKQATVFLIPTPVPALGIAHGLWLKR